MRVVVVLGSHRKGGDSSKLAEGVAQGLDLKATDEQVVVALNRCRILPCLACDQCKDDDCVIQDDFEAIMAEIEKADLVVFATPVYFNGVSSMMKTFIDRAQQYFHGSQAFSEKSRDVILIATGGAEEYEEQFAGVRLNFTFFIQYLNGKLWNFVQVSGTDKMPVDERQGLMKNMHMIGRQWRELYDARS